MSTTNRTKPRELTQAEIKKLITEQITRAVQHRGLVQYLFDTLDKIDENAPIT